MLNFRLLRLVLTAIFLLTAGLFCNADELRIVSLSPSLTELVFQLGKGPNLVGRSAVCDYPAGAAELPVAGNFADPDIERILKLKPDLVITNDLRHPGKDRALTRAGIRFVRMQCRNMDEYIRWVEKLGVLLNCSEPAAREIRRIKTRLEKFRIQTAKLKRKKTVCWVIWDSPLMIAGSGSLPETVIGYAGGVNVAKDLHPEYIKVSKDWLLKVQPEILVWTCSRPLNRKDRFWSSLKAVKFGRVIMAPDSSLLQRPGPRLPDGIEMLKREMEKLK